MIACENENRTVGGNEAGDGGNLADSEDEIGVTEVAKSLYHASSAIGYREENFSPFRSLAIHGATFFLQTL